MTTSQNVEDIDAQNCKNAKLQIFAKLQYNLKNCKIVQIRRYSKFVTITSS